MDDIKERTSCPRLNCSRQPPAAKIGRRSLLSVCLSVCLSLCVRVCVSAIVYISNYVSYTSGMKLEHIVNFFDFFSKLDLQLFCTVHFE